MKNLFVISGITGMTGSELAHQIVQNGDSVIGFDNFFASSLETIEDILENERLDFREGDINDRDFLNGLEKKVLSEKSNYGKVIYINCAAVVHTEYFYHVDATFQTNVIGMKSLLEQAVRVQADIFINCSTSEVYSMQSWNKGGVCENDFVVLATAEHSQRTSYAAGKLMTEFFMKDAVEEKKIKGCSLRFANVYSNNELYPKHIIPHTIESLINRKEVVLLENAKRTKRTFLHNTDSCSAVLAVASCEEALDGSVYNVATEEEVSILELVALCAQSLGIEEYEVRYEGFRASDPERRLLSTQKIVDRTGWKPQITLQQGISMCTRYHLQKEQMK